MPLNISPTAKLKQFTALNIPSKKQSNVAMSQSNRFENLLETILTEIHKIYLQYI